MSDFSKDDYLADMDDVEALGAKSSEDEIDKPSSGSLASSIYSSIMKESKVKPVSDAKKDSEKSSKKRKKKSDSIKSADPAASAPAADSAQSAGTQADEKIENEDGSLTPLGKAKAEAAEYLEALQRERAEFINFRNRARKEQDRFRDYGVADVLTALLPALDDIDRAREHEDADSSLVAVGTKIDKVFAKFDVEKFGAKGDEFDPSKYEAVLQKTDENIDKPVVDTVVEAGYCMGDRVIRAARVVVAVPAEN
ncbi:MAG: nucleotide exchange factor GrpE [Bifidobacteriaceae bacterium]|nr:nucleotide exchange factor GrpE [Bifidobacteriaceae bacterium]